MDNTLSLQLLDTLVEKSELALTLIAEKNWECFIDAEQQRQALFEDLKTQDIPNTIDIIDRFKKITRLNKTLLEKSQNHQEQLKEALNKIRKGQSANKAYQQ